MKLQRADGPTDGALPPSDASPEPGGTALSIPAFRWLWLNQLSFFLVNNALRFLYGWVVLDGLDRGESAQGFVVFALGIPW